ncbi:hypothetical protein AB1Y20_012990 [Prymnesium parvum]|uniref:Uncharacterized protein n=1 Tax=Prymnesium parvum TaxID=97485 RepID=A0AB34IMB7_PRYPA
MSSNAFNFNPTATVSSVCSPRVVGCQEPAADNYFSSANVAGYCDYPGCTDSSALNFDAEANRDTGLCEYSRLGCTISYALNYAIDANTDDADAVCIKARLAGSCKSLGVWLLQR